VNGHQVIRAAVATSSPVSIPGDLLVEGENLIEIFTRDGLVPKSVSLRPRA
jgi:hypothetical protein